MDTAATTPTSGATTPNAGSPTPAGQITDDQAQALIDKFAKDRYWIENSGDNQNQQDIWSRYLDEDKKALSDKLAPLNDPQATGLIDRLDQDEKALADTQAHPGKDFFAYMANLQLEKKEQEVVDRDKKDLKDKLLSLNNLPSNNSNPSANPSNTGAPPSGDAPSSTSDAGANPSNTGVPPNGYAPSSTSPNSSSAFAPTCIPPQYPPIYPSSNTLMQDIDRLTDLREFLREFGQFLPPEQRYMLAAEVSSAEHKVIQDIEAGNNPVWGNSLSQPGSSFSSFGDSSSQFGNPFYQAGDPSNQIAA